MIWQYKCLEMDAVVLVCLVSCNSHTQLAFPVYQVMPFLG